MWRALSSVISHEKLLWMLLTDLNGVTQISTLIILGWCYTVSLSFSFKSTLFNLLIFCGQVIDLISTVQILSGLNSEELYELIKDSQNNSLRFISENGSSIQVSIYCLSYIIISDLKNEIKTNIILLLLFYYYCYTLPPPPFSQSFS